MTCKDCISFAKCLEYECTPYYGLDSACNNVEQLCENFKNKADFVEVVRCKDCKQFMEYAEGVQCVEKANGDCFIRMMCCIDRQFVGVTYDDFCSYGEMDVSKMEITTEGGKAE